MMLGLRRWVRATSAISRCQLRRYRRKYLKFQSGISIPERRVVVAAFHMEAFRLAGVRITARRE